MWLAELVHEVLAEWIGRHTKSYKALLGGQMKWSCVGPHSSASPQWAWWPGGIRMVQVESDLRHRKIY